MKEEEEEEEEEEKEEEEGQTDRQTDRHTDRKLASQSKPLTPIGINPLAGMVAGIKPRLHLHDVRYENPCNRRFHKIVNSVFNLFRPIRVLIRVIPG